MNRLAIASLLAASVGAITLAAQGQRITTHPAEPYLKQLFPTAAAVSAHEGTPLHWKIYGKTETNTPDRTPLALAWWSTDVVPHERGYNGPTHMFIGMDMTGVITGAIMAFSTDPYAGWSVEPPAFAAQFSGKSIRAPFRVGEDIHAVSRATLTVSSATRAVRDSARTMAKLFLNPANVRPGSGAGPAGTPTLK
jgi:transcriptional regulator of nitric oxide reductase